MTRSNFWTIVSIVFVMVMVVIVADAVGIGTSNLGALDPLNPDNMTPDGGLTEEPSGGVLSALKTAWNYIRIFWALVSFQADWHWLINAMVGVPMNAGLIFIIITMIRGGAR